MNQDLASFLPADKIAADVCRSPTNICISCHCWNTWVIDTAVFKSFNQTSKWSPSEEMISEDFFNLLFIPYAQPLSENGDIMDRMI